MITTECTESTEKREARERYTRHLVQPGLASPTFWCSMSGVLMLNVGRDRQQLPLWHCAKAPYNTHLI